MLARKRRRDLRRHLAQTIAIAVTVLVGAALAVASADSYQDLEASYARVFDETGFADLWIDGGDSGAIAGALAGEPGVTAVPRAVADVPIEVGGRRLLGRVVAQPADARVNRLLVRDGRGLDDGDRDGVVVEQHLADHDHVHVGDTLSILTPGGWRRVTVRGIGASAEYLWPARDRQDVLPSPGSFGVVFAVPALAQAAGWEIDEVAVAIASPATETSVRAAAVAHGARAVTTRAEQASNATLRSDIDGFRGMAWMFPALFLGAAGLATAVLLARRVRTERSIIGTLRACGVGRHAIVGHYLGHGLWLAGTGAAAGAAIGHFAASATARAYTHAIDIPITVTAAHPLTLAAVVLAAIAVALIAAAGPAYAASRVAPAEAMRGIVPVAGRGGRSWLERLPLVGRVLGTLPARWRLVVRGLARSPRRAVSVAIGVILAATLVVVAWGMLDSTKALFARQFETIEREDATLALDRTADDAVVRTIAAVPGVAAAEPSAQTPITLRAGDRTATSTLLALPAATSMHGFTSMDGHDVRLGDGLVLGAGLAAKLGVRAGDSVLVQPAFGPPRKMLVDAFVDEPLDGRSYAALGTAPAGAPHAVLVRFAPDADRAAVLARLRARPGVAVVVDTRELAVAFDGYLSLFRVVVGVMLVFGGALAFVILYVTQSVAIAERTTELATLRAYGVARRRLAGLVSAEGLVVTLLALAPGLVVGVVTARAFLTSIAGDLFRMQLVVRPAMLGVVAITLVAAAAVSQWPALRALRRLDIARVVRERSA